jgi:hypothetical protein
MQLHSTRQVMEFRAGEKKKEEAIEETRGRFNLTCEDAN